MSQDKHTPGPWVGISDTGVYAGDVIVFETGCGCCTEKKLSVADAQLISSCPDLLKSVDMMLNGIESGCGFQSSSDEFWKGVELARLARSKAKGEEK